MSLGRVVGILVVILVLYAIITQPVSSAAMVRSGGNALATAGTSLTEFFERIAPGGSTGSVSRSSSSSSGAGAPATYRVRSGDTLSSIAARYSVDADTLAARNGLANRDRIVPGQRLSLR